MPEGRPCEEIPDRKVTVKDVEMETLSKERMLIIERSQECERRTVEFKGQRRTKDLSLHHKTQGKRAESCGDEEQKMRKT